MGYSGVGWNLENNNTNTCVGGAGVPVCTAAAATCRCLSQASDAGNSALTAATVITQNAYLAAARSAFLYQNNHDEWSINQGKTLSSVNDAIQ
jgi:hypothetical protein